MRAVFTATLLVALAISAQGAMLRNPGAQAHFRKHRRGNLHYDPKSSEITALETLLPGGVFPNSIPEIVDWRKGGYVTTPVDGGQCGGVETAVAETTNIESQIAIHNKEAVVGLSYQELIDCAIGCEGSKLNAGAYWAIANNSGKIATAASYTSGTGSNKCNPTSGKTGATVKKVHHLPKHEATMAYAVATLGPIAIALDAQSLETYTSGVLTNCLATQIDEGASLVGYNTKASPAYWILKNSWGTTWGDNGYAYLAFGNNTCGITFDPTTAEIVY